MEKLFLMAAGIGIMIILIQGLSLIFKKIENGIKRKN